MIAYKVVKNINGKLFGIFPGLSNDIKIEYKTDGSTIVPKVKNSLIFIFDNLEFAKHHVCQEGAELWEADVDIIVPIEKIVALPWNEEIFAFWAGETKILKDGKKIDILIFFVENIFGCNQLKMVKKIV